MLLIRFNKTIFTKILLLIIILCCVSCFNYVVSNQSQNHLPYASLDNEVAVKKIHQRLINDPENISLRYQLVNIFLEELFLDDAIFELQQIIRIDTYNTSAYQLLSLLFYKKADSDIKKAISTLIDGLVFMPTNASLHSNLAVLFVEKGQLAKATQEANKVLDFSTDPELTSAAHLILASIFKKQGNKALAEQHYIIATNIKPSIANTERPIIIPVYNGKEILPFIFNFSSHPTLQNRCWYLDKLTR
ncbi:MAG: hypothetical protein HQK79_22100 [Desulfobacterales bacterium]|nr:hypothetical protein [Desulfobacterales bacterium]